MSGPLVGVSADGRGGVGARGRVEHDNVTDAGMVDQTVGEHSLADRQRGHHRRTRDPVRLDHERLDQEGQPDRDGDGEHELRQ